MHDHLHTVRTRQVLSAIEQTSQCSVGKIDLILTDVSSVTPSKVENMQQIPPRFWHALVPRNGLLTESYCLECNRFITASRSEFKLALSEITHRAKCKVRGESEKTVSSERKQPGRLAC